MNEEKLIQYIKGSRIPEDELIEILDWIEASETNQKRYNDLKNLWVLTGLKQAKGHQSRKLFLAKNQKQKAKLKLRWLKYAAVIVLAFISGAFSLYLINQKEPVLLSNVYNEIQAPDGEKSMVTLYDGTKVWLNSGTTLKYPANFNSQSRDVLVEGEAYFDVSKDELKPFIVHAGQMEVKVHGTRFNIYSYLSDDMLVATLEEGQVSVSISGSAKSFKIQPGEQFGFSKSSRTAKLVKVDTELYTSWKENILKVEDASLAEVLKKMERWYGVKFVIDENLDTSERYTLSIKTESLREMLNILSLTTQMNYEIENDVVRIVGF